MTTDELIASRDVSALADEVERLRGVLLWALWHHQGAMSPVGQPIRRVLGMGDHDVMTAVLTRQASDAVAKIMSPIGESQ